MHTYHYFSLWLGFGIFYLLLLVLASLLPAMWFPLPADSIQLFPHLDKLIHWLMYSILVSYFSILLCLHKRPYGYGLVLIVLATLLGLSMEMLQGMTASRSFDWLDQLANTLGAASGWLLAQSPLQNTLTWLEQKWLQGRATA